MLYCCCCRRHLVSAIPTPPCLPACRASAAASSGGGGGLAGADLAALSKMLSWPPGQLFPVLDLARLLVLGRSAADVLAASAGALAADSPPGSLGAALAAACSEPAVPAAQQTAVRLACNCFVQPPALAWVQSAGSRLLDCFACCAASPNKNVRQGLATLLVNYAVMLSKLASAELEFKSRVSRTLLASGWAAAPMGCHDFAVVLCHQPAAPSPGCLYGPARQSRVVSSTHSTRLSCACWAAPPPLVQLLALAVELLNSSPADDTETRFRWGQRGLGLAWGGRGT
jgi:hypothetical protein